jgi:hypothetical protein
MDEQYPGLLPLSRLAISGARPIGLTLRFL